MARTTADVLADRLIDWGVSVVFGLPATASTESWKRCGPGRISCRSFRCATKRPPRSWRAATRSTPASSASASPRPGPGAIHLLNGLYDAKLDGAPVLAITGQTYHDLIGTRYQQEVDLLSLFKDVAVYNQQVLGAGHVRALVDAGCRAALSQRGVAHITCPVDLQEQAVADDEPSRRKSKGTPPPRGSRPIVVPARGRPAARGRHAECGHEDGDPRRPGRAGRRRRARAARRLLAAPIVKPLLGKAVVPDDSPFTTGGIGLLGTAPSELAMEKCDTLLMVGTSFPYMEFYPSTRSAGRCRSTRSVPDRAALSD